jgi:hypothetical protein
MHYLHIIVTSKDTDKIMRANRMVVHIRLPEVVHSSIWNVVSQFTLPLWITVIITMVILALLLSATWYVGIQCNNHQESISYRLQDTWLYTLGIMCQQGNALPHLCYYGHCRLGSVKHYRGWRRHRKFPLPFVA